MEHPSETMDERIPCSFCGEGNDKGSRFCTHCGKSFPGLDKIRFRNRYIVFAATVLIIAAAIGFLKSGLFESNLIGKVNGEGIDRKEFLEKVGRMKTFYESRYGDSLFQGEEGKENLNRLKAQVIDEMMEEKVLLQEAKNAGYTSAPSEEIEKQFESIKSENGLSDADIEKRFGGSIEDLKAELVKGWIISQFVEKAILKGNQVNGNLLFAQWFEKAKAKAKIETYEKWESIAAAKASCCTNGCGGGGRAQPLDPRIEQEAKTKALEYYEKKTQKKGANARVTNFGCHIQVDIIEDGKVVVSLTYTEGEVQEI